MRNFFLILFITTNLFGQRISSSKISRIINRNSVFSKAHVSIAIQPLGSGKKIKGVQSSKYMTPASNTKLLTFLGAIQTFDSIPVINYSIKNNELHISSTGYPFLFHPIYPDQSFESFLNSYEKIIYHDPDLILSRFRPGWAWDDYPFYFSAETNVFPLFGNVARVTKSDKNNILVYPDNFKILKDSLFNNKIIRNEINNTFIVNPYRFKYNDTIYIPFKTSKKLTLELLNQNLNSEVEISSDKLQFYNVLYSNDASKIYSAILKSSDNLVAESLLLMIGKELNDDFSPIKTINSLKRKWKSWTPDPLIWYDGSGLSRYSMVTPRTLVSVLQKIYTQIDIEGIKKYFAVGGKSGTIKNYYKKGGAPFVFAKTGTLRNNHNLSGYIISKKGNWYVFSIMVNHFESPTNQIRSAIVDILEYVYKRG